MLIPAAPLDPVAAAHNPALAAPVYIGDQSLLYCICRQPETVDMIGCDQCDEWFHAACFGINLASIADIQNFPFACP